MALRKGTQRPAQAADTSGVQRAHEGLMRSQDANTQMSQSIGDSVQGAVGDVRKQQQMDQQQGQFDQDIAARKERLDVEMAKGGLQFQGDGNDKKIVPTEGAASSEAHSRELADRKAATQEKRAETELLKTQTYLANAQMQALKAGYTDTSTGELTQEGQEHAKSLYKQLGIGKARSLEAKLIKGEEGAEAEARSMIGDMPPEAGMEQPGSEGQGMGMTERLLKAVRANIDHKIISGIHASGGVMPDHDHISMESEAFQAFNGWRQAYVQLSRSGQIPLPPFKGQTEKNRYFNKIAAKAVASGLPLPGSLAEPSLTDGLVAAEAPTGNPDDGSQQQPAGPPGVDSSLAAPGAFTPDAGGAGQDWGAVQ